MDTTAAHDEQAEPVRALLRTREPGEPSMDDELHDLIASLKRVRREGRLILLVTRLSAIFASLIAIALAMGVIDFALRFPMWIRAAVWVVGMTFVVWAVYRHIRSTWFFRPSLTDLALRIENSNPELKGLLASAVDFSRSGDASRSNASSSGVIARNLARRVVSQAGAQWSEAKHSSVIRLSGLTRRAGALAGAISLSVILLVWSPAMWSIGAERVLAPWSGISWPKRTGVVDITEGDVHPLGTALPLRAALIKTNRGASGTMVAVRYRLVSDGRIGSARRELLTWQGRDAMASRQDLTSQGALFERLIEPVADAIEFRFETEDDKTPWRRIRLIEPPAVLGAQAIITPPEYAAQILAARLQGDGAQLGSAAATIDLGPGTDERAIAPPSLAGSTIELVINVNREIEIPVALKHATDTMVVVEETGTTWRFRWTLDESARLPIKLVDEYGIESVEDIIYRFESLADRPSSATITKPESDRTVLPTAVIDLVGEGRDDVGLAWVVIEQEYWTPAGGDGSEPSGPGGALRRQGEPVEIVRSEDLGSTVLLASAILDLGVLGVRSGDEIRLTAIAQDLLSAMSTGAEPTHSIVRRLRIISETEFVDEIRGELAEIRQRAHSIEQRQVELRERTQAGENNSETRRGQAQVTDRVARQGEQMQRLLNRVEENALDNQELQQLMNEAQRRLAQAGEASSQASEELNEASQRVEDASKSEPRGEQEDPEERAQRNAEEAQEAAQSQRDVQEALNNLIELLDRGEDNLAVKIGVQRLLDQQRALREQTQQAGQQTAGKSAQELTQQERSDLEQIVDKQNQIASEFDELLEEMRDRQEDLEQHDSGAAQAMAQAANRAEQQQVSEQMRQAAQQASQNQTARAQEQQQNAEESLEELLKNLDEGEKAKDEALRRALKSIIESLESVIAQLTTEIGRLDEREANKEPIADLDEGMIRVNRNTLGILDLAEVSGSELGPIANLVERASDAQGAAISEMRFPMASAMSVRGHEARSLELLNRALEEAEELDDQIEKKQREDRLRALRQSYREILEDQVDLREQAELLANVERLTRRDRVAMRGLSDTQELVRDALAGLLRETQELIESGVFSYAHKRLDASATRAIDALSEAKPARAVRAQKSVERGIRGILEALKDPKPDDTPFDEPEGSGGGEQGGGDGGPKPLIPPVKELMLLRDIQTDIADMTSELNDAPDTPELPGEIKLLADDQRSLMDVGKEFLEKAKNNQPAVPDMPGADRPDDAQDGAGEPFDPFAEPNSDNDEPVEQNDGGSES